MSDVYDVVVVGGGVVGCAVARALSIHGVSVALVEASSDVGAGTSKANTAILHTGFDTDVGSLESALVTEGHGMLASYAERAGIAVEGVGAVLVAWDDDQAEALDALASKAVANSVDDVVLLERHEVVEREPHLGPGVRRGLLVPRESIIDPWSVTLAFAHDVVATGGVIWRSRRVVGVAPGEEHTKLDLADGGSVLARWVVNAAGMGADLLDRLFGIDDFTITARRGQLIVFDKLARTLLRGIILPVPTERTKGVLVSPTTYGNVLLGPTAEDLDERDDAAVTAEGLASLLEAGRRILPELIDEEVTATYAGLRTATAERDYQLATHIDERLVTVGGIRSTGLSASMAIGRHVAGLLVAMDAVPGAVREPDPPAMPPLGATQRRPAHDPERIAASSSAGLVVCHCEQVSEAEVRDACQGPLGARELGGVRRRTRAMNGRCQGFSCAATVLFLVADELGVEPASLVGLGGDRSA